MTQDIMTTDLSDAHAGALQYLAPTYRDFGGRVRFHGPAKTLLTFLTTPKCAPPCKPLAKGACWWSMAAGRWSALYLVETSPNWLRITVGQALSFTAACATKPN